jgi:hypothetical protein
MKCRTKIYYRGSDLVNLQNLKNNLQKWELGTNKCDKSLNKLKDNSTKCYKKIKRKQNKKNSFIRIKCKSYKNRKNKSKNKSKTLNQS